MDWKRLGVFTEAVGLLCLYTLFVPVWIGILLAVVLVLEPVSTRIGFMIGFFMAALGLIFCIAGPFYILSRVKKNMGVK